MLHIARNTGLLHKKRQIMFLVGCPTTVWTFLCSLHKSSCNLSNLSLGHTITGVLQSSLLGEPTHICEELCPRCLSAPAFPGWTISLDVNRMLPFYMPHPLNASRIIILGAFKGWGMYDCQACRPGNHNQNVTRWEIHVVTDFSCSLLMLGTSTNFLKTPFIC